MLVKIDQHRMLFYDINHSFRCDYAIAVYSNGS